MSEYQYYDFRALDRKLTGVEMEELRLISSRATITPDRFENSYSYGDFRGNPLELMRRYFDAHLYVANWGTHTLMLRIPSALLDRNEAARYAAGDALQLHDAEGATVLEINAETEDGGGWLDEAEAKAWTRRLLPLRKEIAAGDLRPLYIGWLAGLQNVDLDHAALEPPLPPGLRNPTAAQKTLIDFLYLEEDLLKVARKIDVSQGPVRPETHAVKDWLLALRAAEKDELLSRFFAGEEALLREEIVRRYSTERAGTLPAAVTSSRTVRQIIEAWRPDLLEE